MGFPGEVTHVTGVVARFRFDGVAREAALVGAVWGGVLVAALTEVLSPFGGLTRGWLLVAWGVALAAAGFLAVRVWLRRVSRPLPPLRTVGWSLDLAMAAFIVGVVALTGAIALFAVPITVDSMTYHLARVAHWAQNATVAFYPTHVIRQLYQPPWAEYAIMHLFILLGGDRLANLVQWGSMVLSLLGVSLIARQLGAGMRGQLLSAFVCATIPMGIMQSSTTQNDYAAALWLVCLTSTLLALPSRPGLLPVLGAGASLGLALLTKGTAYLFAAPVVVVFLLVERSRPISKKLGQAVVIGLCALALNAPQYVRNLELFGSPLGPGEEVGYRYMNHGFSPSLVASNLVRNVGLHAGTPWPAANAQVERVIGAMHRGMGISVDDPRITWPGTRFQVAPLAVHEDLAGNGLHLLLIAAALAAAWCSRGDARVRAFAGCLVVAFLLFCLIFRWQPWHSRLQLPLFVLGAPLIGVLFERLKPALLAIALLLLAGSSVRFLTENNAHHLVGRRSIFSSSWAEQRVAHAWPAYVGATRFVLSTGCAEVGLFLRGDDREYFVWALLADVGWRGRLGPVLVGNASAGLPHAAKSLLRPCAIVRNGVAGATEKGLTLGAQDYRAVWYRDDVQVLVPAPGSRAD